jgi:glycosyltransferase involved in cell wall biosynthesis
VATRVTILTGIFPPDIGGPATSVPELIRWLANNGWDPTVVTLADSTEAGGDAVPVARVFRGLPWPRRALAINRALRSSRPQVVLANGLHLESALLSGTPVVQKIVGDWAWERARNGGWTDVGIDDFQQAPVGSRTRALRLLRSAVTRRARRVVVPSQHLARLVRSWGVDASRISVVPNAAPDLEPGSSRDAQRGVFVGRLVSWKHVDHAISVLPRLPEVRLDVLGTGPALESLRRLAHSLEVDDRVAFHGALPRERALALMGSAGFLVLPSSYEGMPHVVLEAFALGVPVVASDAPGTVEIVEDGMSGLLYRFGELDELEGLLRKVSSPQLTERLSRGGRAAAARFTLDASAASMSRALDKALGG